MAPPIKDRDKTLASVALINLPGLFAQKPDTLFNAIQELHEILARLAGVEAVHVCSAASGAILVAPNAAFNKNRHPQPLALHHLFEPLFAECNKAGLPLRIGVTHGWVEFFEDVVGGTFIGQPVNFSARLAFSERNQGLLYEQSYLDFVQHDSDASTFAPDLQQTFDVKGKEHDPRFVCAGPKHLPVIAKDYSGAKVIHPHPDTIEGFIVAVDLPGFSKGSFEQLSHRFRGFVDAGKSALSGLADGDTFYIPGGRRRRFCVLGYPAHSRRSLETRRDCVTT